MLLGQVNIPNQILISCFADSLNSVESQLIKGWLGFDSASFSAGTQAKLINRLSRFGSRLLPTPANLRQQVAQVARFEFLMKPAAAHAAIYSGILAAENRSG